MTTAGEGSDDEEEEAEEEVRALEAMVVEAKRKAEAARRKKFDGVEIPTTARPAHIGRQGVSQGTGAEAGMSREAGYEVGD